MDNIKYKPTVLYKFFTVKEGEDSIVYYIWKHHLPDYFWVYSLATNTSMGYFKTTVWEQIDRKQWIIQPPKQ